MHGDDILKDWKRQYGLRWLVVPVRVRAPRTSKEHIVRNRKESLESLEAPQSRSRGLRSVWTLPTIQAAELALDLDGSVETLSDRRRLPEMTIPSDQLKTDSTDSL
jgi:hypothetical protein